MISWTRVFKLFLALNLFNAAFANAEISCLVRNEISRTGYLLSDRQMAILWNNHFLSRNKGKSVEDKIKSVEKHVVAQWKSDELPALQAKSLARLIVEVSEAVGIDYQILAAIIQKESGYCRFRFNATGGDSGCMQFTNPALKELKHQLGFSGADKHSSGMPEMIFALANRYYQKHDAQRFDKYKKWISLDINSLKSDLRTGSNYEFDILTGALFLKINLALAGANYGIAVRNYNGSQKKFEYQKKVLENASKVALEYFEIEELACIASEEFEIEVMKKSCELEDDATNCVKSYIRTLSSST